jgi:exodeoxyribonuclease III
MRSFPAERSSALATVPSGTARNPGTALRSLSVIKSLSKLDGASPATLDDSHSRYIEAAIDGIVVGCLYLPNGNPAPGPKFDYKLRWFERLHAYVNELLELEVPVAQWLDDALFRPEVRAAYADFVDQGWTDAIRFLHPDERIYTFWKYFRNSFARDAGLRIDHFLLSPSLRERPTASGVDKFARGWEHTSDHAPVWIELDGG